MRGTVSATARLAIAYLVVSMAEASSFRQLKADLVRTTG
jgi:hypothetical protein